MAEYQHALVTGAATPHGCTAARAGRRARHPCRLVVGLMLALLRPANSHADCPAPDAPPRAIAAGDMCLVTEPVVDLRREPKTALSPAGSDGQFVVDRQQETQLLFCEQVRVEAIRDGWARVEAIEQQEFTRNGQWQGYPGWCPVEALARKPDDFAADAVVRSPEARLHTSPDRADQAKRIGVGARIDVLDADDRWVRIRCPGGGSAWLLRKHITMLEELPGDASQLRSAIVRSASQFVGQPYLWGGRSFHDPQLRDGRATGVDCSGLVHTAYRLNGIPIPRDAHEQFLRARPTALGELRPGDLIFLARRDSPDKIFHVLLSLGGEQAIESSLDGNGVRFITMKGKTGMALQDASAAGMTGRFVVYAGSFLPRGR